MLWRHRRIDSNSQVELVAIVYFNFFIAFYSLPALKSYLLLFFGSHNFLNWNVIFVGAGAYWHLRFVLGFFEGRLDKISWQLYDTLLCEIGWNSTILAQFFLLPVHYLADIFLLGVIFFFYGWTLEVYDIFIAGFFRVFVLWSRDFDGFHRLDLHHFLEQNFTFGSFSLGIFHFL